MTEFEEKQIKLLEAEMMAAKALLHKIDDLIFDFWEREEGE